MFDVQHITPILSKDSENEIFADASFLAVGPIEATAETCVYIDWPKSYRIPVFVKAVIHSFAARVRIKFSCKSKNDNYL